MELDTIYTGLIVGLLFGFVLQRGRFCMNSAFRDGANLTLGPAILEAIMRY